MGDISDHMAVCPFCGGMVPRKEGEVSAVGQESMQCPHCRKTVLARVGASVRRESQKSSGEADELIDLESRIIPCPHCKNRLDVSSFDPLQLVECCCCGKIFELLKQFERYTLLKNYNVGWPNALYLARRTDTHEMAILKVLSVQALAQHPNAVDEFIKESEEFSKECRSVDAYRSLVASVKVHLFYGYHYFALTLREDVVPEHALLTLGLIPKLTPDQEKRVVDGWKRLTHCSHCNAMNDVTSHDPLDRVNCSQCQKEFEVLRDFGKYHLEKRVNHGGNSNLYMAHPIEDVDKKVAVKVLMASEMQNDRESVKSFLKEMELTKQLQHPNLIQVYEGGEWYGFFYIVLELVEGHSLGEILAHIQRYDAEHEQKEKKDALVGHLFKSNIPEFICLEIGLQAASALGVVHNKGLVHGDIKPENIMLTYQGVIKVLDFGLVQFANAEKLLKEDSGNYSFMGTPLYIPPERVFGETEDFRSDIYSLGATLHYLLRGLPPFQARKLEDLPLMHASAPLISFKGVAPWVSEPTCRIIEKALRKNVADRYSSHVEFIADLTLSKNLLMQSMGVHAKDARRTLKEFIVSLNFETRSLAFWTRVTTQVMRTYRHLTRTVRRIIKMPKQKL